MNGEVGVSSIKILCSGLTSLGGPCSFVLVVVEILIGCFIQSAVKWFMAMMVIMIIIVIKLSYFHL